jgi:crossover junction endodeoxyribonuclease RuvC
MGRQHAVIILGVDPGTLATGYGVIEVRNGRFSLIDSGLVKNRQQEGMPQRLKAIYDGLSSVIARHHPDEFAIETAFYGKNIQSTLKIGQARGVSLLSAANSNLPTSEYAPREVKQAIAGNGAASKQQVRFMVKSILGLAEAPKVLDVTDAIAVAICHGMKSANALLVPRKTPRRSKRGSSAWSAFAKSNPSRILKTP